MELAAAVVCIIPGFYLPARVSAAPGPLGPAPPRRAADREWGRGVVRGPRGRCGLQGCGEGDQAASSREQRVMKIGLVVPVSSPLPGGYCVAGWARWAG